MNSLLVRWSVPRLVLRRALGYSRVGVSRACRSGGGAYEIRSLRIYIQLGKNEMGHKLSEYGMLDDGADA